MKPAQKILEQEAALPSAETKLNHLKLVIEKLTQNDRYTYIGMDHFARPTDELAVAQRAEDPAAQFPGIQHQRRHGHLRVRHVGHFAGRRRVLAEPSRICPGTMRRWIPAGSLLPKATF
jgi:hypothetical protein